MSPSPSFFQRVVRCLVLRLALLLGGRIGVRILELRWEIAALPEGSRRRVWLERDLARLEGLLDWLNDPETMDDPVNRGMIAEAAARGFDPGRRAWIRWRWIYGWATRFRRLPRAFGLVGDVRLEGRSTTDKMTQNTVRAAAFSRAPMFCGA